MESGNQAIRVIGPAPGGAQFIEVVTDELPLRQAMYRFSRNLLVVSLIIAVVTAALVYLALHYLFVRPMRRLTAGLVAFHEDPESSARIIVPSQRGDEIGVAERELSDMQRDLVSMLHQKSRLAALGLAVSKINHDLRNLLASSQLLSDQLASVPDPRVQRFAPKLMRSLERAIAFCQSTLSYGRAQEAAPDRRMVPIEPIVAEVQGNRGAGGRRLHCLDQRDRARVDRRRRSRSAVSGAAQSGAQRRAGAGKPAASRCRQPADQGHGPPRRRGCDPGSLGHRPRRPRQGPRASVRGVPDPRGAPAAAVSGWRSPPNWSAPMAATFIWSRAPSGQPSASSSRIGRWNCSRSATSGPGHRLGPHIADLQPYR